MKIEEITNEIMIKDAAALLNLKRDDFTRMFDEIILKNCDDRLPHKRYEALMQTQKKIMAIKYCEYACLISEDRFDGDFGVMIKLVKYPYINDIFNCDNKDFIYTSKDPNVIEKILALTPKKDKDAWFTISIPTLDEAIDFITNSIRTRVTSN